MRLQPFVVVNISAAVHPRPVSDASTSTSECMLKEAGSPLSGPERAEAVQDGAGASVLNVSSATADNVSSRNGKVNDTPPNSDDGEQLQAVE